MRKVIERLIEIAVAVFLLSGIAFAALAVYLAYKHGMPPEACNCVTDMYGRGCYEC